jgi:hypothetical protein
MNFLEAVRLRKQGEEKLRQLEQLYYQMHPTTKTGPHAPCSCAHSPGWEVARDRAVALDDLNSFHPPHLVTSATPLNAKFDYVDPVVTVHEANSKVTSVFAAIETDRIRSALDVGAPHALLVARRISSAVRPLSATSLRNAVPPSHHMVDPRHPVSLTATAHPLKLPPPPQCSEPPLQPAPFPAHTPPFEPLSSVAISNPSLTRVPKGGGSRLTLRVLLTPPHYTPSSSAAVFVSSTRRMAVDVTLLRGAASLTTPAWPLDDEANLFLELDGVPSEPIRITFYPPPQILKIDPPALLLHTRAVVTFRISNPPSSIKMLSLRFGRATLGVDVAIGTLHPHAATPPSSDGCVDAQVWVGPSDVVGPVTFRVSANGVDYTPPPADFFYFYDAPRNVAISPQIATLGTAALRVSAMLPNLTDTQALVVKATLPSPDGPVSAVLAAKAKGGVIKFRMPPLLATGLARFAFSFDGGSTAFDAPAPLRIVAEPSCTGEGGLHLFYCWHLLISLRGWSKF